MNNSPDAILSRMSLEQKAGQVMAIGFDGTQASPELLQLIEQLGIGGINFFARNVESPEQVALLTNALQAAARNHSQPGLLLAIDQEGGRVARLTEDRGFSEFPSAMALGATGDPENARQAAQAIAQEMRAVGLNANFAPVLDVNNNAANPVIGTRSFSFEPRLVADFGLAFVDGLQSEGVLAFGKHFPGHGDTNQDSHFALPTVAHDRERLEAVEFVPFRAAIQAGVGAIMSAHINFRAVEPEGLPGTLSKRVMTGLIREELGFQGLLATDSLEMGALAASGYPVPMAAATALQAGADLLLFNRDHELHRQAHAMIVEWVREEKISSARLDEAVRRVLQTKARYDMLDPRSVDPSKAVAVCSSAVHRTLSRTLAKKAIRLVRQGSVQIPLRSALVLEVPGAGGLADRLGFSAMQVPENPDGGEVDNIASLAQAAVRTGQVLLVTLLDAHVRAPGQLELIQKLAAAGMPLLVAALRSPFDLDEVPEGITALATYGNNPPALDALSEILLGNA